MGNNIYICKYDSPCGRLVIGAIGDSLCLCDWDIDGRRDKVDRRVCSYFGCDMVAISTPVIESVIGQLNEYFAGKRRVFDVKPAMAGTDFQQTVWRALSELGYGETVSYSEIANHIGRPTSVRAVASAVGANPMSIIVPCHRVIGATDELTGYAGGLDAKKYLLDLESGR